ncbi:MAG: LysR family transcriptional regulator [Pseudomonadota bacterium]|jgi:LysR family carnitine catabolism transcriptional activator
MKITLIQLRSFLAVAEALSFTAAAERLHVKQPTLSATIRNLEVALGGSLFDRSTHKVRLTALGQECKRLSRRLLDEAEQTETALQRHIQGKTGALRIAAVPNIFPTLLKPALAEFRVRCPGIDLQFADVSSDEAIELLRSEQADMAIALQTGDASDLRYRFLDEQRYVAVLPAQHPLAQGESISWQSLADERLIQLKSRDTVGTQVSLALRNAGVVSRISHRVNELSTVIGLLEAGYGIALMGHHSARSVLKPGWVMRDLSAPRMVGRIAMITLADKELTPQIISLQQTLLDGVPVQVDGSNTHGVKGEGPLHIS